MTNIQLAQKFMRDDALFEKLHKIPLKSWVDYTDTIHNLTDEQKEEIVYVVKKVSEWRDYQAQIDASFAQAKKDRDAGKMV